MSFKTKNQVNEVNGINPNNKIKISKRMSYELRHNKNIGIKMDSAGYVNLKDFAEKINSSIKIIKTIVEEDPKKRYSIKKIKNIDNIRANQGHSIETNLSDLLMPITLETSPKYIVHATKLKNIKSIYRNGLDKINRTHIHFSPDEDSVTLRRHGVDCLILVDIKRAISEGVNFFISENNVILCSDNIPSKYFFRVVDLTPEYNCAGVIVIHVDSEENIWTVLVQGKNNFFSFPKGKIEKGESTRQCAKRELMEETSLDLNYLNERYDMHFVETNKRSLISYNVAFSEVKCNLKQECINEIQTVKWFLVEDVFELGYDMISYQRQYILSQLVDEIKRK